MRDFDAGNYFDTLNNVLPLDPDTQLELIHKVYNEQCEDSIEMLWKHNLRLVYDVIKKNYPNLKCDVDALQEGSLGLLTGIRKMNPSKGALSTYTKWWIKRAIDEYILKSKTVRPSVHVHQTINRLKNIMYKNNITWEEAIIEDDTKLGHIQAIEQGLFEKCSDDVLYYTPAKIDHYENINAQFAREDCEYYMSCLNEQEKYIITHYFGLGNNPHILLKDLSSNINKSRQRVSQIIKRSMNKMKKFAAAC